MAAADPGEPTKASADEGSMTLPNVALSLRQPWAHAVIHGGKRIENRVRWSTSRFRGPLLIHAAKGVTEDEYDDAVIFAGLRGLPWAQTVPEWKQLQRGGIVGVCNVVGIMRQDRLNPRLGMIEIGNGRRKPTDDETRWWMGGFALVLEDVRPLPFTTCKGALGFFKVPADVLLTLQTRVDHEAWAARDRADASVPGGA